MPPSDQVTNGKDYHHVGPEALGKISSSTSIGDQLDLKKLYVDYQTKLAGPDIFCADSWKNDCDHNTCKGPVTTVNHKSKFGSIGIRPFPFRLTMTWDHTADSGSHCEGDIPSWTQHQARLLELVEQQKKESYRIEIRKELRGAALCEQKINFKYVDHENTVDIQRGSETCTQTWTYNSGKISIENDSKTELKPRELGAKTNFDSGFRVFMKYEGAEVHYTLKNISKEDRGTESDGKKKLTLKEEDLGIDHSNYSMTKELAFILGRLEDYQSLGIACTSQEITKMKANRTNIEKGKKKKRRKRRKKKKINNF